MSNYKIKNRLILTIIFVCLIFPLVKTDSNNSLDKNNPNNNYLNPIPDFTEEEKESEFTFNKLISAEDQRKDNSPPTLLSPTSGTYTNDRTPTLDWTDVSGSDKYNVQVSTSSSFSTLIVDLNIDPSYYTCPTLGDGVYYWRVRTRQLLIFWGSWSSVWQFIVDGTPPSAPSLGSPSNGLVTYDNTQIFTWSSVSGCNLYRLQIDDYSGFTSPAVNIQTSYTYYNAPALADRTYYWRVSARDYAGNWGAWSVVRTFTIDTTPPAAPVLVSPTNGYLTNDPTQLLDWDPSVTATNYRLYVDDNSDFSSPVITIITSATSYTTSTLADRTYYWHVQAVDSVGNWGPWSSTWHFTIDTTAPGVPVIYEPANGIIINDEKPYFDWSDVADAVAYQLQVDDSAAFDSPIFNGEIGTSGFEYVYVLPDDVYYWRVRSRDTVGNYGAWTSTKTFTVDTTAPTNLGFDINPEIP
ncbi:MAG: hypothetical protein FK734_09880, partial [Asgard group archaeon]|nr:hypothetical protein [Asgard group archaeon]